MKLGLNPYVGKGTNTNCYRYQFGFCFWYSVVHIHYAVFQILATGLNHICFKHLGVGSAYISEFIGK